VLPLSSPRARPRSGALACGAVPRLRFQLGLARGRLPHGRAGRGQGIAEPVDASGSGLPPVERRCRVFYSWVEAIDGPFDVLFVSVILIAALSATTAAAEILIGMAAPMTGATNAWFGGQVEHGAALAVADINAAGGVRGQQVRLITVDDYCDAEQAVAAAKKLVSEGVIFVVGHFARTPRSRHRQSTRRQKS
jgi:hypothetical protein